MGGNLCQLGLYLLLIFLRFRTTESQGGSSLSYTPCAHRFTADQPDEEPLGGLGRVPHRGPALGLATLPSFQGKATAPKFALDLHVHVFALLDLILLLEGRGDICQGFAFFTTRYLRYSQDSTGTC